MTLGASSSASKRAPCRHSALRSAQPAREPGSGRTFSATRSTNSPVWPSFGALPCPHYVSSANHSLGTRAATASPVSLPRFPRRWHARSHSATHHLVAAVRHHGLCAAAANSLYALAPPFLALARPARVLKRRRAGAAEPSAAGARDGNAVLVPQVQQILARGGQYYHVPVVAGRVLERKEVEKGGGERRGPVNMGGRSKGQRLEEERME